MSRLALTALPRVCRAAVSWPAVSWPAADSPASTRATLPVSSPVWPGRMSAFSTSDTRLPYRPTASQARLTTSMHSSQSPSMVVNIESVRFGRPDSRTIRTASVTASDTDPERISSGQFTDTGRGNRERDQHAAHRSWWADATLGRHPLAPIQFSGC